MANDRPTPLRVSRFVFAAESISFGCLALTFLPGALLALFSAGFLFVGLDVLAICVGLAVVAGFLWVLRSKVTRKPDLWAAAAFAIEIPLIVVGLEAFNFEDAYTRRHPYTEGPFADGANGAIGLTGLTLLVGGAVVVGALLWQLVADAITRRHTDRNL